MKRRTAIIPSRVPTLEEIRYVAKKGGAVFIAFVYPREGESGFSALNRMLGLPAMSYSDRITLEGIHVVRPYMMKHPEDSGDGILEKAKLTVFIAETIGCQIVSDDEYLADFRAQQPPARTRTRKKKSSKKL